jgi:dipeptidyl aminopeptidase/acylaminoacyl peptidase
MKYIPLLLVALAFSAPQQPPATEVYLAPLPPQNGTLQWINISNSPGYDNQPSFLPDSSAILFSSNRDGKQTDIYRYDIASKKLTQVTNTPEAEYSPTVTPDRKSFSAVRVEADNAQRLWRFDWDGSNPRVILENVKPVGYHAWIDDTHLALFILGSGNNAPATLQLADTKTGTATVAVTGIGRSLLMRPKTGTISYLATTETPRVFKELDPKTGESRTLIAPLEGSQDAAWLPDGRLLMAKDATFFEWQPGTTAWTQVAVAWGIHRIDPPDMPLKPGTNLRNITRLAVSPDGRWLAFVAEPEPR